MQTSAAVPHTDSPAGQAPQIRRLASDGSFVSPPLAPQLPTVRSSQEDSSSTRALNALEQRQRRLDPSGANEALQQNLSELSDAHDRFLAKDPRHDPTYRSSQNPSKPTRRGWSRSDLERNISPTLLNALDHFLKNIPSIPNQVDHGKKTSNRDMRGWITSLEEPNVAPLWDSLVNVLRSDSTPKSWWGHYWDRHLCRYILGVVVPKEKSASSSEGRSQTRQAVNNAIKRELECHLEDGKPQRGKSARSKTFRDLFREKCRNAGVSLPPYEDRASSAPVPVSHGGLDSDSAKFLHTQTTGSPPESTNFSPTGGIQSMELNDRDIEYLQSLRISCNQNDEWGQTAWWKLESDADVKRLPTLLAHQHLFELRSLLIDFRWVKRTFECIDFNTGMRQIPTEGYDTMIEKIRQRRISNFPAKDVEGFRLIRNAVMMILPIVKEDSAAEFKERPFYAHLATQLTGRLLDLKRRFASIASLVHSIEVYAPRPWLRPLSRCFLQPRTDIKLVVPSIGTFTPHLIVLSEDGKLLVVSGTTRTRNAPPDSTSRKQHMIWVWNVETGQCEFKNETVPSIVQQLALSRNNSCVSFETSEGLFSWHFRSPNERMVTHKEDGQKVTDVTSITPTALPNSILTTHRWQEEKNYSLALWNTEDGSVRRKFTTVWSNANCVDVSPDGDLFVSGHDNGFIHLWSLSVSAEQSPILSFKNIISKIGAQPIDDVRKANNITGTKHKIVSISYREQPDSKLIAVISVDEKIRVWKLPPNVRTGNDMLSFMTARCTAVISRRRTRQVQWAQKECFFTGGDDGMARVWHRFHNSWKWHAIEKNQEELSKISTVLISVGKRSHLVATYLTKSPYVTVWDMAHYGNKDWCSINERAYRSHCAMKHTSVDATDIQEMPARGKSFVPRGSGLDNEPNFINHLGVYRGNNTDVGETLNYYFTTLDPKSRTQALGTMQPRLVMDLEYEKLEVCFEQPVRRCVSGVFWLQADSGAEYSNVVDATGDCEEGERLGRSNSGVGSEIMDEMSNGIVPKNKPERRGMAVALQDGSVALFELEGDVDVVALKDRIKGEPKIEGKLILTVSEALVGSKRTNLGEDGESKEGGNEREDVSVEGGSNEEIGDAADENSNRRSKRRRLPSNLNNGGEGNTNSKIANT